jgi:hypothetical protein
MKKIIISMIVLIFVMIGCSKKGGVSGPEDTFTPTMTPLVNSTDFPDSAVRTSIVNAINNHYIASGSPTPTVITQADLDWITLLSLPSTTTDLSGLEFLHNLGWLEVQSISTINITSLTPLTNLPLGHIRFYQPITASQSNIKTVLDYLYCENQGLSPYYVVYTSSWTWTAPVTCP